MAGSQYVKQSLLPDELGRGFPALLRYGPYLFISNSEGYRDPDTEKLDDNLVHKPIEQCHNAFRRIANRLEKAGCGHESIIRILTFNSGQEWSLKRMATWPEHFGPTGTAQAVAWGTHGKTVDFNAISAYGMALMPEVERRIVEKGPGEGRAARITQAGDFVYVYGVGGNDNPFTKEEVSFTAEHALERQHSNNFEWLRYYIEKVPGTMDDWVRLDAGLRRNPADAPAYRDLTKQIFNGKIPFAHFEVPFGELANRYIQLGGLAVSRGVDKEIHWSVADPNDAESVTAGGLVFVSALNGNRDAKTGELLPLLHADKQGQAKQALSCLEAALTRAGTSMDRVLSLEAFTRDTYFQDEFVETAVATFGKDAPAIGSAGAEMEDGVDIQVVAIAAA
ncbi:MAG: RidA family protein [Chloroflexota bacterium]